MCVLPRSIQWIFGGSGHACRGDVASAKEGVVAVKLRVKRQRLLLRAFRKRRQLLAVKNCTRQIKPTDILAFSTVRNESLRLPFFLAHYRQLGVRHFFFVSNNSTDSTNDYLAAQPDVSLWISAHSYKLSRFGMDWLPWLQFRYANRQSPLVLDAGC
jgi:hypothetical protein